MNDPCYRYEKINKPSEFEEISNNPTNDRIDTGKKADIKKFAKKVKQKIKNKTKLQLDQLLYKDFHREFKHLPFEILNDIRFWNYLGMNDFRFLLEKRWGNSDPKRYIGAQTKEGLSRHGISRLFWMGDQPFITAPYKMNDIMLGRQDTYTQLTERNLSLSAEISESLIKNLKQKNQDENEFRATIKKVRRTGGTKLIYAMNEADVTKIIK